MRHARDVLCSQVRLTIGLCLLIGVLIGLPSALEAQSPPQMPPEAARVIPFEAARAKINGSTLSIISGNPNGSYLRIAHDIAAVSDEADHLRVLPVVGRGAVQNARDILFMRGIDMGLVNTISLNYLRADPEIGTYLSRHLVYITRLFEDELHILVRPGISSLSDLAGKRVNFSDAGSGSELAARQMFDALNIPVRGQTMGQADAIELMKRGELDATLCTCLRPLRPYRDVAPELGFQLLPIPYDGHFLADYLPSELTHADYPDLIPEGQTVETVAVPTLLVTFKWPSDHPRYALMTRFVERFFSQLTALQKPPRHPRWKNINLAARVDGWARFQPAQDWLDRVAASKLLEAPRNASGEEGAPAPATPGQAGPAGDALFKEFLEWRRQRGL